MTQECSPALAGDLSLVLCTHKGQLTTACNSCSVHIGRLTNAYNSGSRRSATLLWTLPRVPALT